jgi:hypothetical protein
MSLNDTNLSNFVPNVDRMKLNWLLLCFELKEVPNNSFVRTWYGLSVDKNFTSKTSNFLIIGKNVQKRCLTSTWVNKTELTKRNPNFLRHLISKWNLLEIKFKKKKKKKQRVPEDPITAQISPGWTTSETFLNILIRRGRFLQENPPLFGRSEYLIFFNSTRHPEIRLLMSSSVHALLDLKKKNTIR